MPGHSSVHSPCGSTSGYSCWIFSATSGHLPRAKARSRGRELAPQPGATRSIHPALQGREAPGRDARLLLRLLPEQSGVGWGAWKLIPELGGSETTFQAGTLRVTGLAKGRGGRPAGSGVRLGRREPPIYLGMEHTPHQNSVVVASTLFPPKLPHTHTHTPGHIPPVHGPAHHSPCWVAPGGSCPCPLGSKQGRAQGVRLQSPPPPQGCQRGLTGCRQRSPKLSSWNPTGEGKI